MQRLLSSLALVLALAACGQDAPGSSPADLNAVSILELRTGKGPLAQVALATEAYLRSKGEDPDQYLLSKVPEHDGATVLYAIYNRKAFPVTVVGDPGFGSRYVELDASQGQVVREWGMQ